jgi:hypothetical protein
VLVQVEFSQGLHFIIKSNNNNPAQS